MYTPAIARETPNPLPECVEMTGPLFASVALAPPDPILGLNEAFGADPRPEKINLGVGVYFGEDGKIPVLDSVRRAETERLANPVARGYQPIDGPAAYNRAVQDLLFGAGSEPAAGGRLVTAQSLGGTGALSLGAALLKRIVPDSHVLISDPSWENHRALFEAAGFPVAAYPYYDAATHGLDFDGMRAMLRAAAPQTIVVLHACCHNPTGVDLTPEQWNEIIAILRERACIPFLDLAYQGFADGIEADSAVVRSFAASGMPCFIASSFSKSFSLYGERVGALTIVTADADESRRVLSQLKRVIRTNYSNPPTHGAALVAAILGNAELRARWEAELGGMRERIKAMRDTLVSLLGQRLPGVDFSFVRTQRGMFSYSGLTAAQVARLREEFAIYAVSTGRICIAALNRKNIEAVADAVAAVSKR
ncbi:aromatic amino acid aminotransferase [Burkholderiales bacterium GJ-E10]|nr:aromatic amino acid aminotransferase [Burkholderiales bacterium GJ-E10]